MSWTTRVAVAAAALTLFALHGVAQERPLPTPTAPMVEVGEPLLEAALAEIERIARDGGFATIAATATLRPGERGPLIADLDQRLRQTGELAVSRPDPLLFDTLLQDAVRRFQARNGLETDGLVGRRTLARLNEPAHELAKRIRANLVRARVNPVPPRGRAIVVNLPDFSLKAYRDGQAYLAMPVIVGRPDRETPLFQARITHLVINPDWTVPPVILKKDVAQHMLARDLDYLTSHGFRLVTAESIQPLGFESADWAAVAAGRRDLRLVQPPGPNNPLGRVKFLLPNPYAVYLHDTNDRNKFREFERALSSGCVRVGDPLALAAFVAEGTDLPWRDWLADPAWRTRWLSLPGAVTIAFVYRTAWVDEAGVLQIRADIYGLDAGAMAQVAAAEITAAN